MSYFASLPNPVANVLYFLQMIYWTDFYEISARQTLTMKSWESKMTKVAYWNPAMRGFLTILNYKAGKIARTSDYCGSKAIPARERQCWWLASWTCWQMIWRGLMLSHTSFAKTLFHTLTTLSRCFEVLSGSCYGIIAPCANIFLMNTAVKARIVATTEARKFLKDQAHFLF